MSFYQNQDDARRKTLLLVGYFLLAIIMIVSLVNLAVYVILFLSSMEKFSIRQWLQSPLCWAIAGITLLVIVGGSLLRITQLGKGGISVALMAGATPLDPATQNPKERILINVVEEMSIASGTSIPRIFVMQDEMGINAFVAGTEPRNTILAVTQGTLEKLNRDELQGVIGHEFSHILNGDMKLNLKLMGVLAGILLIGQLGEFLLSGSRRRHYNRHHHSSSNKSDAQLIPLGLALMVIGYVGLFFGRLIKAAISRQRELLADASSVQFTRNPEGIASALYAIHHYSGHGLLLNRHAEDMSHMCFGTAVKHRLNGMLATHPPIEERVRSIDATLWPRMKARFKNRSQHTQETAPTNRTSPLPEQASGFSAIPYSADTETKVDTKQIKASIGTPTPQHQLYAHELHDAIPISLKSHAHNGNAEWLLYALFLQGDSNPTNALKLLALTTNQASSIKNMVENLTASDARFRLPILDMTLSTLRLKPEEQRKKLLQNCITLIKADRRITLSEFVYYFLAQQALGDRKRNVRSIKSFQKVEASLAVLFSTIVQCSGDSKQKQRDNFQQIMSYFSKKDFTPQLDQPASANALNHALSRLSHLTPLLKQPLVDACVDCILHDEKVVLKEIELLRAVCEALDCPMPPLLINP